MHYPYTSIKPENPPACVASVTLKNGHVYTIYEDGTHEGFEDVLSVGRYWITWMRQKEAKRYLREEALRISQAAALSSQDVNTSNESRLGGSQDSSANELLASSDSSGDR